MNARRSSAYPTRIALILALALLPLAASAQEPSAAEPAVAPEAVADDDAPEAPPEAAPPEEAAPAAHEPGFTAADPDLHPDALALMVKPLRREPLAAEVESWLGLLEGQTRRIVAAELRLRDAEGDAKTALLEELNELREQRAAILDRVDVVLRSFERKGGDVEEAQQYVDALAGVELDVSDADALIAGARSWLTSREGGIRWAVNLTQAVAILVVSLVVSVLASRGVRRALSRTRNPSALAVDFLTKSTRRVVVFVGVVLALMALEFDIGPVLAVVGAAGFVVAFALQDSLGNFASGILMLVYRPFDVGDAIEAGGVSGTVQSMNLVSTQIKTFDNKSVVVPNNSVWGGVITNATRTDRRRVDLVFGIGYDDSIPDALRVLEEVVAAHELVLADPAPVIRVHELGDSSVNIICRPWTKTADYWTVYWDLTRGVKERFDAEGISIPFPQRDVHLYQSAKD